MTTDYVLDEAATYLRLRASSPALKQFRRVLDSSASVETIWTASARCWAAWDMLAERNDKRWNLTDCINFVTMETLGIRSALAFDSDLSQAGLDELRALR